MYVYIYICIYITHIYMCEVVWIFACLFSAWSTCYALYSLIIHFLVAAFALRKAKLKHQILSKIIWIPLP